MISSIRTTELTVARLGAVLAEMAVLVAVAALDGRQVAWFRALFGVVTLLATVAASTAAAALGAITREVSHSRHVSYQFPSDHRQQGQTHFHHTCGIQRRQPSAALDTRQPCGPTCYIWLSAMCMCNQPWKVSTNPQFLHANLSTRGTGPVVCPLAALALHLKCRCTPYSRERDGLSRCS
jgi:hypothetical protein